VLFSRSNIYAIASKAPFDRDCLTSLEDVRIVRAATAAPVLIGSGATPENVSQVFDLVDGFIVGSTFKEAGKANNFVEPARVSTFMTAIKTLRACASV
jgi:uncharacterized protein